MFEQQIDMKKGYTNLISLTDRKYLMVDGVEHVGNFNEKEISLMTNMGFLTLKGEGLHIAQLNLEEGNLVVEGRISSIGFLDGKNSGGLRSKNMLHRVFK